MTKTATTSSAISNLESIIKSGAEFRTRATIRGEDNELYDLIIDINEWWLVGCVRHTGDITGPQCATMRDTANEERPFLHKRFRGIGRTEQEHDKSKKWYTLGAIFQNLAEGSPTARFLVNTVRLEHYEKKKPSSEELLAVVTEAWCDAFGVEVPTDADLEAAKAAYNDYFREQKEYAISLFHSGEQGIAEWNKRSSYYRKRLNLTKMDLSNCNLKSIELGSLSVNGSNFSGADLSDANLFMTVAEKARFNDCTINSANLEYLNAEKASFDNARIKNCCCKTSSLKGASIKNTSFSNCDLTDANFRGTDLSVAHFDKCNFTRAVFDDKTVFPANFDSMDKLRWCGRGIDPRTIKALSAGYSGSLDFGKLLERLQLMDAKRCKNAVDMLKKEKFELFSEIDSSSITGVIKSQTNEDLVYSCSLTSDGNASCCTQNLKVCGGLRGAICKHIVLLIVGLTRAGKFNPGDADAWMQASLTKKPALDKDRASQVFLKYKGAVAGEIDWRPTETTPEDFYAF